MSFHSLPGLAHVLIISLFAQYTSAANYVFAEHVNAYTKSHTSDTWANDLDLAAKTGIDAFAITISYPIHAPEQIAKAFAAAEAADYVKLFFTFDYVNGEAWPTAEVIELLKNYTTSSAYYFMGEQYDVPFVSTIGGRNNGFDWTQNGDIRNDFGPFYVVFDVTGANWEDLVGAGTGAGPQAFTIRNMWPVGATNKTGAEDEAFEKDVLGQDGIQYMMGVSPWFFHSAHPGLNWVWRGDDLWYERWTQVLDPKISPKFVMIVSWNDFGSSHYIGPIHFKSEAPAPSVAYLQSHDAWRNTVLYWVGKFKKNADPDFALHDQVVYWYIRAPTAGGSPCGVVGNNAQDGQTEIPADEVVEDAIFIQASLLEPATISVKIGSFQTVSYHGTKGQNFWSLPFNGETGVPYITFNRNGKKLGWSSGNKEIYAKTILADGCTNYNPFVNSFTPTLDG